MNSLNTFKHIKSLKREFYVAEISQISAKEIFIQKTDDITLFSGKRIMLIFDENIYFKQNPVWCTYYKTHQNGKNDIVEKLVLDKPYNQELQIGTIIKYYTSFVVNYDNEALTETDALLKLKPIESKYGESTNINNPLDFILEGKYGLISPENEYKLNRLNTEFKFTDIGFFEDVYNTIALIKINDDDYNITPYTVNVIIDTKLSFNLTLYFDKICVNGSFLKINSFWCYDDNLKINLSANTETFDEQRYLRIKLSFSETQQSVKISVGVNNISKLANLNEISGEQSSIFNLKFGNSDNALISNQILGYSYSARYSLPLVGETIYLPKEIVNGDLNDFKNSGYYFGEILDNNNILNSPIVNQNKLLSQFRLCVESHNDNCVYQRIVCFKTHSYITNVENGNVINSNTTPYIFERIFFNDSWTEWLEIGRLEHSHNLYDLAENENSLHFSKEYLDILQKLESSSNNTPWKSILIQSNDQLDPSLYRNGDVVSVLTGGIYQLNNNNFERLDINGLYVFGLNDESSDPNQKGLINKELYDQIFSNAFMKKINDNNSFVLVSNNTEDYPELIENIFDFVKRDSQVSFNNNTISLGFSETLASSENSIAIGINVKQSNIGCSLGCNIISNGIGCFGIGLTSKSNQTIIGKYNSILDIDGVIFGGGDSDSNRKTIGYLDNEGYLNAKGFKYYAESNNNTEVENNPQNYILKANGEFEDVRNLATKEDIEEIENSKLDKGNSSVIVLETLDNKKYSFVFAIDPDIVQIQGPNNNNIIVAFGAYYIEFLEESITINVDSNNPSIKISENVSSTDQSQTIEITYNEETQKYDVIDFSSYISEEKMNNLNITNFPTIFDYNTYIVTYKDGQTLDLSEYFITE